LLNSQDHRGTPEAPGRVVTLIERAYWESLVDHHAQAPERTWGVAYRIVSDKIAEVRDYLDIREINGYSIHYTPFHPAAGGAPIRTLVYIGTPDNDQFTGPQDPQALAEHIYRSAGPSGLNKDYLLGLEAALDELSPDSGDEHVTDLACRVRAIEREQSGTVAANIEVDDASLSTSTHKVPSPPSPPVHAEFKQASSVEEQEETEKPS
jgi:glutathione-specific gamma-glutamylcyclotransferase